MTPSRTTEEGFKDGELKKERISAIVPCLASLGIDRQAQRLIVDVCEIESIEFFFNLILPSGVYP